MAKVNGTWFGPRLCEVLGLDANLVRAIDLHIEAAEVRVTTVSYLEGPEVEAIAQLVTEYELKERDDG